MIGWLKHLYQRYNDWCGDRDMELAIRKHLTANGFFGGTAKLRNVRLVSVQRPGWLQVYRFEATVRLRPSDLSDDSVDSPAEYCELYGLVRDDIRHNINHVRFFENAELRRELFTDWSEDLICLRGAHGLSAVTKT